MTKINISQFSVVLDKVKKGPRSLQTGPGRNFPRDMKARGETLRHDANNFIPALHIFITFIAFPSHINNSDTPSTSIINMCMF